jgi:transposase
MANKIRAKLILELLAKGMSGREIQRTRRIAQQSVKKVKDTADTIGLTWEKAQSMSDDEVYYALFPEQAQKEALYEPVDYAYVHKELQKSGVTLKLLWQEYCDSAVQDNKLSVSYTSFSRGYKEYTVANNVTNHIEHKPGVALEIDWSGTTMPITNSLTGEVSRAYLFVATLPYSQYTYVEATSDMKQNTWLRCHVNAYKFFDGVAIRCVCDNLKTGVITHPKHGEIVLNQAYEELGRHYGCAIMPAPVRTPKAKASVEGSVGKIAMAIVAPLRNTVFFNLTDLNEAIQEKLKKFNEAPFQKREGSRKIVFDEIEHDALMPLPPTDFEICEWIYGRAVNLDFHVIYKTNRYSVPYEYVGKKADLKITDNLVEIYVGGNRVASHTKFHELVSYKYKTDKSHMPPQFIKPEWDDVRMLRWAKDIGPNTEIVVTKIFNEVKIKEQAYNPVLAVLNLSKRYGNEELELACGYALQKIPIPRCKFIKTVLASKAASRGDGDKDASELCGYIRGDKYYSSNKEAGRD